MTSNLHPNPNSIPNPNVTNSNVLICDVGTGVAQGVYTPLYLGPIRSGPADHIPESLETEFCVVVDQLGHTFSAFLVQSQ